MAISLKNLNIRCIEIDTLLLTLPYVEGRTLTLDVLKLALLNLPALTVYEEP